jgi:Tol biopolymer transport system component
LIHVLDTLRCVVRRPFARAIALAAAGVLATSITWSAGAGAQTADMVVAPGRLLGATRFQLAWLDWNAPRPVFLTALASPAVAHDAAALPGGTTALLSVSKPATDGRNWGVDPSDILGVDLNSAEGGRIQPRSVLMRADPAESLSWPAWWPDGSSFVFQREDDAAPAVQSPDGFARPPARIELAQADGSARRLLVASGWQPSPAPDGSAVAFVRFTDRGSSLIAIGSSDGVEHVLVDNGVFPEIFSPRYSPDGRVIAFGARSFADLQPAAQSQTGLSDLFGVMQPATASAHGTLADVWQVNADGSNLHQISNLRVHDPALAWAPDGSQLFAYGEWGGVLIDLNSGENTLMTYLTGTTAVAWLP